MNINHLFVHLAACLTLSGCMVFYRTLDTATNDKASAALHADNCHVSYYIKPTWSGDVHPKDDTVFSLPPYFEDYRNWTESTIKELRCQPVQAESEDAADLVLVINGFQIPAQYAQGPRFISTLTLFIFPIPMGETDYRKYEFHFKNGETRYVKVANAGWLGWIFLPAFPFSFWNYPEKQIFTSQLREYLSAM